MATVTIGAAQGGQPETLHVGVNAAVCKVSLSVSWSSGDVHRIGKIPNGAIPLDVVWYPGAATGATFVAKFGTSASQELFLASDSYGTNESTGIFRGIRALGTAKQISIADDAVVNYDYITMVATANISVGHVGDLVVYYKMPGQTL
jgi:hypothetical protein